MMPIAPVIGAVLRLEFIQPLVHMFKRLTQCGLAIFTMFPDGRHGWGAAFFFIPYTFPLMHLCLLEIN